MKNMKLIFSNGQTASYNRSDIEKLEDAYEEIKYRVLQTNSNFILKTDDNKHETLINVDHLVAVDIEY